MSSPAQYLTIAELVGFIAETKGAKFASLTYRAEGTGELARHSLIFGFSYGTLLQKDLLKCQELLPTLSGIEKMACLSLIDSINKSIVSFEKGIKNEDYTCADTYVHLVGCHGTKVHKETGHLYVEALSQGKMVLEPGEYKEKGKSADLVIAKRQIEKDHLRRSHYRQFKLTKVAICKMDGETLIVA
jgi:hypothetical protein